MPILAQAAAGSGDAPGPTQDDQPTVRPQLDPRYRRDRSPRNHFAFLALIAGICAWVPLVIVVAAPLTVGFAILGELQARRTGHARGAHAGRAGLVLAGVATALQATVFASASLLGWFWSAIVSVWQLVVGWVTAIG